MLLAFDIVDDGARLGKLTEEWLALLARSDDNQPMRGPAWLLPWWQVFGDQGGRTLCVATWRSGGRLVGLAPMLRRHHRYRRAIGFWRLEPLGTGEDQADEVCSEYLGLVAERGAADEVTNAFASALTSGGFGLVDELVLPAMPAGDLGDGASQLAAALRRRGWSVELTPCAPAPFIPLPRSYDEYIAALPRKSRYDVRRAQRELDTWAGGECSLHVANDEASVAEGLRLLAKLHGQRWRSAGQSGVFASPRFTRFLELATGELRRRDALDLSWLSCRGEPVAVLYSIVWDGRVLFYQSGRRVDLPRGVKPGIVCLAMAIGRSIALGRREFDFLGGIALYKKDLALAARSMASLRAVRPSWREQARRATEHGLARARAWRDRLRRAAARQPPGTDGADPA